MFLPYKRLVLSSVGDGDTVIYKVALVHIASNCVTLPESDGNSRSIVKQLYTLLGSTILYHTISRGYFCSFFSLTKQFLAPLLQSANSKLVFRDFLGVHFQAILIVGPEPEVPGVKSAKSYPSDPGIRRTWSASVED